MFNSFFYNRTIENYTKCILDLFNNINIQKYNTDKIPLETKHVYIDYGPKDKLYQRRKEDYSSEGGTKYYIQLPRMVLTGPSLSRDIERAVSTNSIRYWYIQALDIQDVDSFINDIQPTPYNFEYTLSIRTNRIEEWAQIVEQILPAFNPYVYIRTREIANLNVERDIPVGIGSINPIFENNPQSETTKRSIICDIPITVKGWLYGNQSSINNMIKYIDSKYFVEDIEEGFDRTSVLVSQYNTSAAEYDNDGNIITSAIPEYYSFSGINNNDNYYFTSGESF